MENRGGSVQVIDASGHAWYSQKMRNIIFVSIVLLCIAGSGYADIYKFVDDNGVIYLTNTPRGDGYRKVITEETPAPDSDINAIIRNKSRKYNIDPSVIRALISAESNWDIHAVSDKGAIGLMQLMPATAQELQIQNPFDPEQNIEGGTRYLRMLLDRFDGDMELAIAAYNAGPSAVEKSGGVPSITETRKFVRSVISSFRGQAGGETKIQKVTFDDGTVLYTNVPVRHAPSVLRKF